RIYRRVMIRKGFPALASLLLFPSLMIPVPARAQAWSGILDPSRATDWTKAGIQGGVPNYTTVCKTVAPSGKTDATDSEDINAALASPDCDGRSAVVQLQAGTYTITKGIVFNKDLKTFAQPINHVVLRGAGPDKTRLVFTSVGPCGGDICVQGSKSWVLRFTTFGGGSARWMGDNGVSGSYAKGDNSIVVGPWTGRAPSVGSIIFLDQRDDSIGICPISGGTGNCSGESGASETGTTVTIRTTLPHGYAVGECVGIGSVGGKRGITAYNSVRNVSASCDGYSGWVRITATPSSNSFQYVASESGLATSGGGYVTADTGGILVSNVQGATVQEESTQGRRCPPESVAPDAACGAGEISQRSQLEIKTITSVTAGGVGSCPGGHTCYGIDPPLKMSNWRSSQAPGVWWSGSTDMWDGIEDLTYDLTHDGGGSGNGGIRFTNAYNSWARNVRAINVNRNAVWIVNSARIDVLDSYFFGTKGSGAQSYAIESMGASDDLIQNNICQHVVTCLMDGQDNGSVYAYNYMVDSNVHVSGWMMPMLSENHDFASMNLFEGNDSPGVNLDNIHGTGNLETTFRSRIVGQDTPAKIKYLTAVHSNAFNRALNFVGNVIGTPGLQTTYQNTSVRLPERVIWALGQLNLSDRTSSDSLSINSLLRWGNYDVVTGAVRWCGNSSNPGWSTMCNSASEIPTTSMQFANASAVPASTTLPSSFYLSSQPAFWLTPWGTPPWPAIGPDVKGGQAPDGVGGYSYAIPAQLCYLNTSVDAAYAAADPKILLFNAANCYPSAYKNLSPAIVAPAKVKAVVH
ncbi:MAG TPA: hypothetical protein VKD24_04625, partial [Candidatus Angelobacter sp.]|nr:hypothetical protein [Candidatus Angelobacter sp.]